VTINDSRSTNNVFTDFPALDALASLFILNLTLHPLVDPDVGWHLRTGLDLVANGWRLPTTDPYSHTMPDWPWVEHAWLTDGVMGFIYHIGSQIGSAGALGISVLFATITSAAFVLAAGRAETGRTSRLLAVVIALWIARPFLGVRTQMVTLLGVALVLWVWSRIASDRWAAVWAVPPLFLLWANLHGGFVAGWVILAALLVGSAAVRLVASRGEEPIPSWWTIRLLGVALVVAGAATLLNPYGLRLHGEIYASLFDRFMIETLHEWQPVSWGNPGGRLYVLYLVGIGLAMLFLYRRRQPLRVLLLAVFLVWSLRHWRNVPFFLLLSVPLLAELMAEAAGRLRAWRPALVPESKRWLLAMTLGGAVAAIVLGPAHLQRVAHAGLATADFFRETEYPIEALQWARSHPDLLGTRPYNDYGFGGFLVWWLPEQKVFIDGRMPAWRIGNRWIFYDYVALTGWEPPELRVLDKYAVDWAIVTRGTPLDIALAGHSGWLGIYGDRKVTIYRKRVGA
jgi:hypothetical protein